MEIFLKFLMVFGLLSAGGDLEPDKNRQEMDQLRQTLSRYILRLESGLGHLEVRTASLRHSGSEEDQERFFEQQQIKTQLELSLLKDLDQRIRLIQQQRAAEAPDFEQVPEEVFRFAAQENLRLPYGGPAPNRETGDFLKACGLLGYVSDNTFLKNEPDISFGEEGSLKLPAAGIISAGTWSYPSGDLHLGMDLALPMFTPLRAPASGVIVYAASVTGDAGGYLGNWIGWPYGGGNTLAMICKSQGKLYALTFCHLSSRILVRPAQKVRQGDLLAYSGNTGNSTGPHTHLELFELLVSFEEAVQYFQQTADFSFGTGWSRPAACSPLACQRRPELYFSK